jgi:predicted enzyme related to lactoylglutathione lyase
MSKLVHWEIPSTDIERSKDFYSRLFGWKTSQWSPDYALFEYDGGGGGIALTETVPGPCIEVYIEVEDIPAALGKVVELGGKTVTEKREIGGGLGFLARFTDPCGVLVGLWSKG